MSELPFLLAPVLLLLAMLMGFVADRTSLCTVCAVAEIFMERRARALWNIAKIVLWVTGITLLVDSVFDLAPVNRNHFMLGWVSLLGGFVFGIGAVLNEGCSLQTITRLGRGDFGMALSIAGMPLGAMLARLVLLEVPALAPVRDGNPLALSGWLQMSLTLILSTWMLWELLRLLRGFRLAEFRRRLLAPDYQPSSSALLLGIANGTLFSLVGTWMLTYTLIQSLTNLAFPDSQLYRPVPVLLWYLLAAYLLGITLSALQSRHARLQARPDPLWVRYFFGGIFMGLGAALVPGGNDVLLLNAMPGFSVHALPSYLAMLVGIGASLMVMQRHSAASREPA